MPIAIIIAVTGIDFFVIKMFRFHWLSSVMYFGKSLYDRLCLQIKRLLRSQIMISVGVAFRLRAGRDKCTIQSNSGHQTQDDSYQELLECICSHKLNTLSPGSGFICGLSYLRYASILEPTFFMELSSVDVRYYFLRLIIE
jgi:hypothetical protein